MILPSVILMTTRSPFDFAISFFLFFPFLGYYGFLKLHRASRWVLLQTRIDSPGVCVVALFAMV